jgi:hypothetical protein
MGSVTSLTNNGKALGLMVIVVAVVLAILQGFQSSGAVTGTANTTVGTGITQIGNIVNNWLAIIVLIIVGGFLISMKIFGNK